MDIYYKDNVSAGTLVVFTLPPVIGQANLFFFNQPASQGTTFVPGVIITKLNFGQRTNTQFQQSLENVIYVYSFGDAMGDLQISGIAFPRLGTGDKNGIQELLKFYKDNRVSRTVSHMQVTFANEVIRGFLVGLSITTLDASSGAHNFTLFLKTLPAAFRSSTSGQASVGEASDIPAEESVVAAAEGQQFG